MTDTIALIVSIIILVSVPFLIVLATYYRHKWKEEEELPRYAHQGYCDHPALVVSLAEAKHEVFALREENRILKQVNERIAKEALECLPYPGQT